ncbi:MAG: bifunctional 3-deoxy-7-phosphoheptulonate synthase/chorismate mutase type II [Flavobacteriaceae bacterium]|nr:bifunctional 3-deoxy-7-phosphoheptulonate synthase/chorismate mutase type II [Flavobacteriaceae bacterium]
MENSKQMRGWLDNFNLPHPLVIAGPCSAETEDQVLKIADKLKDTDVTVFRAGVWKPRTRPGNFEGVGVIGLKWLQKVKEQTQLLTTTEVANKHHVNLALEHDIDILWIGARTTVNPFMVQEIAEALENTEKIVLIKNPINPDISLWLGGLERLYAANIKNLGLIHRGFSTYDKTKYRNIPEWQIPIEVQKRFPDIPLICDPSHIAGRRDLIFQLSQLALDLSFDGLMIETHFDPDQAWSDAKQQITPETLIRYMKELKMKKPTYHEKDYRSELEKFRSEIDILDEQIISILNKRMGVSAKIGQLKYSNDVAILQPRRWKEVLGNMFLEADERGLSKEFVMRVFKSIHQESINHQRSIKSKTQYEIEL